MKIKIIAKYFFATSIFAVILGIPMLAAADSANFTNPLTFTSIEEVMTSLLTNLQTLMVTLAILFIVIGGIIYIMSAGNPGKITLAKNCIFGAVIGLALALAGPSFLTEIKTILQADAIPDPGGLTLTEIVTNILEFVLSIFGLIAIIVLVIAGGMYFAAGGSERNKETAKKMVQYAVIGIIVALSSLVIVNEISTIISGS